MKKQKKITSEEVEKIINNMATDWEDASLQLKINEELKEVSKSSGYSITELKNKINLIVDVKKFYNKYIGKITCAYKKDIYQDSEGNYRCGAKRAEEREKYIFHGITDDVALIECPKDMLTIEFETHDNKKKEEKKEVPKEQLKVWLKQVVENAKQLKIDYCVASHGGTSDYFYACNFSNLIENKEKECKKKLAEILVPKEAYDFIDFSNLGDTLIPIIERQHWKIKKYNGAIHKIIEGKTPISHKNKLPDIILQRVFDEEKIKIPSIKSYGDSDINSIPLTQVVSTSGLKKKGKEYQGANVWHGSSTGMNFCLNTNKNVWHCFRCGSGGGVAKAIALNKGIIKSCDEELTPSQFKEVLEVARNEYGLKKPEKNESPEVISGKYIFDSNKIVKPTIFTCHKINNEYGYGFLMPKEVPIFDGKGIEKKIIGRRQIRSPVVITSGRKLIEPTYETENKFGIKYIAIPNELELRISPEILDKFLKNQNNMITGEEIFNRIKKEGYKKFLFFHNPVWYDIHALWDIGTYFFELFNNFPILELRGVSGTAKSKVMKVSRFFTLNPTKIMVNPSEASLFRITHVNHPTKYIDEAEKLFLFIGGQWQSSPIVELINGSYTKGSAVPRLEKFGNDFKIIYFYVYSPTMLGSISGLRDATETRAITHIMTKAPDKDNRGELEPEDFEVDLIYQEIRNQLYIFALENWQLIENTYKTIEIKTLKKRDLQLWKPILAIAKTINEQLYVRVLEFAEKVSEQRKQDFISEGSVQYKLLSLLKTQLEAGETKVYLKPITKIFNEGKEENKKTAEKTISANFDKLGFKEYRNRDMLGSFLQITKEIFEVIVSPICPTLSSYSSYSSLDNRKEVKSNDEGMTNNDEHKKTGMTNMTNNDEYDEYSEVGGYENKKNFKKNDEKIDFSELDKEFGHG